jgi:omega-6 fatty acid desaturase (delta-12 desaturase)
MKAASQHAKRPSHSAGKATVSLDSKAATAWRSIVSRYDKADPRRALWQVANTYVPYALLWYLMDRSLEISYWLTLGLSVVAAGFLARIFIVMHDCGHGSFVKSKRVNDCLGFVSGILSFTPYHYWRYQHAIHHATAGNLDRRGTGDIWTMTVHEYRQAPLLRRLRYRFYRNPFVLIVIGAIFTFFVKHRFAYPIHGWRWQRSVLWSNLGILAMVAVGSAAMGFQNYLLVQIPVMTLAAASGIWLFYVQHQFDGVYWERGTNWDLYATAMKGSSFYKLPRVLQWFSGNIGFHHIHHLSPRIPNYFLEKCHRENPLFQQATVLRLRESVRTIRYRLWDEERQQLVGIGTAWF